MGTRSTTLAVVVMLLLLSAPGWSCSLPGMGGSGTRMLPKFAVGSMATVGPVSASPASVSLTANNPGSGFSATASISWALSNILVNGNTWSVQVTAGSSCLNIPTSAITVQCTGASVANAGNGSGVATASCSAVSATPLSTTVTLAGGSQGKKNGNPSYTVTAQYAVTDSWKYQAGSCPITLTYLVSAP